VTTRYRRPRLLADSIRPVGDASVELRRGARVLTLDVEGARDLALSDLNALRRGRLRLADRQHPNEGQGDVTPLAAVLDALDALGWIGEARPQGGGDAAAELNALVARGRQVLEGLHAGTRHALERRLLPDRVQGSHRSSSRRSLSAQDVLVSALLAQWRRESSLCAHVLASLFGTRAPIWPAQSQTWPDDLRELEIGVAALVFWALQAEIAPTLLPPVPALRARTPLAADWALRESEAMLRDWNATVPASPILSTRRSAREARNIARGIHLQQYYVSLKYAESVLPVLTRNSASSVRALVWRYLQEELGHEDYELAACLRLGLRDREIRANVPLPAFSVFHRLMAHAAALHPVVWLMALPLAEGLPGERKPLPGVLARDGLQDAAFGAHVEADMNMDHAWMARRIAALLGPLDAATFRQAARLTATAWTLTRQGWEQVVTRFGVAGCDRVVTSAWDWRGL
jgi:hypothetical protein